jgi:hypothetical protein
MLHTRKRTAVFLRNLICFTTLPIFHLTCVAQGQTQPSAPADFDVVSVKLHMTGREVIETLRTRFGATVDPVKGIRVTTSAGTYNTAKPYVSQVHYKAKDFTLNVDFAEIFPASGVRREGAYRISYFADTKTQADKEGIQQKILAKYGAPTTTGVTGDMWCQVATCDLNQPLMEARPSPLDPGFYVGLRDEGFRRRMEEAFSKSKTGSPPL